MSNAQKESIHNFFASTPGFVITMAMIGIAALTLGGCATTLTKTTPAQANASIAVAKAVVGVGGADCTTPAPQPTCVDVPSTASADEAQQAAQTCWAGVALFFAVHEIQTRVCARLGIPVPAPIPTQGASPATPKT